MYYTDDSILPENMAPLIVTVAPFRQATGSDGKVLIIDAGIGVSQPQVTKALAGLGVEPFTHLINT